MIRFSSKSKIFFKQKSTDDREIKFIFLKKTPPKSDHNGKFFFKKTTPGLYIYIILYLFRKM